MLNVDNFLPMHSPLSIDGIADAMRMIGRRFGNELMRWQPLAREAGDLKRQFISFEQSKEAST